MADEPVLYYFDGRGRTEIIRMLLCAAKLKYREVDLTDRAEMLKLIEDGELLFHAVPMLKIDGMNLVQTNAIVHYIARRAGFDGKDLSEKAWVDMYFEGTRDLYMPLLKMLFVEAEEVKAETERNFPKLLPVFDKALEKTVSGFLVGSTMSLADVGLMEALLAIDDYFGHEAFEKYSHLQEYFKKMCDTDTMKHYINHVRKRPNDEKYITTVKKVLGWS